MNRADSILLLKEMIEQLPSFQIAQSVSILRDEQGWFLRAKWLCPVCEKDILDGILMKHGVNISEAENHTIFHKEIRKEAPIGAKYQVC